MAKKEKKSVGRPPKYRTAEELQAKIDEYFQACDADGKLYTVPGIAYFLGFSRRQSIFDLKKKKKFSDTIGRALLRIENQRLDMSLRNKINPNVSMFDLRNNFGYKDEKSISLDGKMDVSHAVYVVPGFSGGGESGGGAGNGGEKG
ncbi:MAG: hypothetical protein GXO75_08295 [Calditrichaeota bacterium]|nr:hypothetical protein [Calditrichota bacterium]